MVGIGKINIHGVSKEFISTEGELVKALSKVSLEVNPGEIVTLVGPSGCGKTTLLRIIAGLETPTTGKLDLDGEDIKGTSHERGLVFQDAKLFPWLNISDNIAFGLKARNLYKGREQDIEKYIELTGLSGFENSYPHQLSGGMRQRAALARAMINHPKVLLLDEPLGALDALTRAKMQGEILNLWRKTQMTMVMVTHDVDEAIYLSDHIVLMSPRPARIIAKIHVDISKPRDRNSSDYIELRKQILDMLNFEGTCI